MRTQLRISHLSILVFGLALPWLGKPAIAQINSPIQDQRIANETQTNQAQSPLVYQPKKTLGSFEGQGRPKRRSSGGARGECSAQLIALLPSTTSENSSSCDNQSTSLLGRTIDASPVLWFYVPKQEESNIEAELVLLDDNRRAIKVQTITLSSLDNRIVGITLDSALEINRVYHWVFSITGTASNPDQILAVEGQIQRISKSDSLAQQLAQAQQLRQRVALFAEFGIWHNALTTLVSLRQLEDQQLAPVQSASISDWQTFLGSVGLEKISTVKVQKL